MCKQIEHLFSLVGELDKEFGRNYILRALKVIANRQMLFLDIPEPSPDFLPILKVLEIVINEIEEVFYKILEQDISEENSKKIFSELISHLKI